MDPEVKNIENFMSIEDCHYYIDTYMDKLERSMMMSYTNNTLVPFLSDRRTSTSYVIPRKEPHSISLRSKIADLLQVDIENTENVQITRYKKGQQLKLHHDFIVDAPNQRVYSVIIYLNDLQEDDGGKTVFPMCKMSITPKTGHAIWFKNCDPDGKRIMKSIHYGGEVLTDTVKYVLTIFIRQRRAI